MRNLSRVLEDKIFFLVHGSKPRGDMFAKFEGGRNAWMTPDDIQNLEQTFVTSDAPANDDSPELVFIETRHHYSPADY